MLIETINSLLLLSSTPPLAYPLLIALSTPTSFADLLSHENSDVVIAVVEVLEEWTDEEVMEVDEEEENAEEEREQRRDAMTQLVKAITEAGVVDLVVATMARLDETDEGERSGVFHALGSSFPLATVRLASSLSFPFQVSSKIFCSSSQRSLLHCMLHHHLSSPFSSIVWGWTNLLQSSTKTGGTLQRFYPSSWVWR